MLCCAFAPPACICTFTLSPGINLRWKEKWKTINAKFQNDHANFINWKSFCLVHLCLKLSMFFCSIFNWHFFESSENNEHFPCVSCEFRGKSFSIFPRDISPSDKQTFCIGNKQKKNQSYAKLCKMIGNLTGCMIFEINCYQECIFIKFYWRRAELNDFCD